MGDPKKLRKKYETPMHPWKKNVIEEEKILKRDFGLNTQKEILIAKTFLKKYKNIAKRLIAQKTAQGLKEKEQILNKLQRLGFIPAGSDLDKILNLGLNDVLNRRLQSVVTKKGLARTQRQARQFIIHRHIVIGSKEITSPSYLLSVEEEAFVGFKEKSTLSSEDHPERVTVQKPKEDKKKEIKPEEPQREEFTEEELEPVKELEI